MVTSPAQAGYARVAIRPDAPSRSATSRCALRHRRLLLVTMLRRCNSLADRFCMITRQKAKMKGLRRMRPPNDTDTAAGPPSLPSKRTKIRSLNHTPTRKIEEAQNSVRFRTFRARGGIVLRWEPVMTEGIFRLRVGSSGRSEANSRLHAACRTRRITQITDPAGTWPRAPFHARSPKVRERFRQADDSDCWYADAGAALPPLAMLGAATCQCSASTFDR